MRFEILMLPIERQKDDTIIKTTQRIDKGKTNYKLKQS